MNLEIDIYDHILDLIKNAEDLLELDQWIRRERNELRKLIDCLNLAL